MANIIRYIDPDASGAGNGLTWVNAYTSLNAAESVEDQDLTDGGGDVMHMYFRSSSGGDDTTTVVFDGWGTNATNKIVLHEDGTDGGDGVCDDVNGQQDLTKYFLDCNTSDSITSYEFIDVIGLQVRQATNGKACISENYDNGAALVINVSYCILLGQTNGPFAVYLNGNSGTVMNVWNTIIYCSAGDGAGCRTDAGTMNVYNCTIRGWYDGIYEPAGVINAYNVASFLNTRANGDFNGVTTITNCADDDGLGSVVLVSASNYAAEFTDITTFDYTIKDAGSVLDEAGTDNPGSGLYSDDIAGTARSSTWDIGAFELAAALGGLSIPIAMHHYKQMQEAG